MICARPEKSVGGLLRSKVLMGKASAEGLKSWLLDHYRGGSERRRREIWRSMMSGSPDGWLPFMRMIENGRARQFLVDHAH